MSSTSTNCLSNAASAYLRQHAENPVHWQQWSKQTLEAAKQQNKPILLSVGYAACHWCHVMAHECFENSEIAAIMNDLFVNIKVDREERPDIDQIYMAALTAMGEQGGWPLTIFLTPDGHPFWGGTYFPPESRYGRPGFKDILYGIDRLWRKDKGKVNHNTQVIFNHISDRLAPSKTQDEALPPIETTFQNYVGQISTLIDQHYGGLKGAPKFPSAPLMETLFLSWLYSGTIQHRDDFLLSLTTMLQGGIYDHLGGGLCRYSVDERWLVPHFEKMLYDNAQLIRHACWAYAETGHDLFRIRIEETIEWLKRDMALPGGAFASSLDADSEGEEGKYYVWSENEIDTLLGDKSRDFKHFYDVSQAGNFEGKNIINLLSSSNIPVSDDNFSYEKQVLLHQRQNRIAPSRDDKALTDWNALLIRALGDAGKLFKRSDWIDLAVNAYRYIYESISNGRPAHCSMGDTISYPALSTDYAALINAALTLHSIFPDQAYLQDAIQLADNLHLWHSHDSGDAYRLTATDADDVILRIFGDYDEATPGATAQIIDALTRLAMTTGDMARAVHVEKLGQQAMIRTQAQPYGQAALLNAIRISSDPWTLVLAVDACNHELVSLANLYPDPRRTDIFIQIDPLKPTQIVLPGGGSANISKPTAYLCRGHLCLPPVYTTKDLQFHLTEHV